MFYWVFIFIVSLAALGLIYHYKGRIASVWFVFDVVFAIIVANFFLTLAGLIVTAILFLSLIGYIVYTCFAEK